MKLVRQYHDVFDAENLAEKLENKGILTFVSSARSHRFGVFSTGAMKVGVWVVLKHQHEDALKYLDNPKHKITTALSKEEIEALKQQPNYKPLLIGLIKLLVLVSLVVSVLIFFIYPG